MAVIWSAGVVQSLTTRRWITTALVTIRSSVRLTMMNTMNGCCRCDAATVHVRCLVRCRFLYFVICAGLMLQVLPKRDRVTFHFQTDFVGLILISLHYTFASSHTVPRCFWHLTEEFSRQELFVEDYFWQGRANYDLSMHFNWPAMAWTCTPDGPWMAFYVYLRYKNSDISMSLLLLADYQQVIII